MHPDLYIPAFIVGLLILMIFSINAFILETSVDNRVQDEVQMQSTLAIQVIGEELRGLESIVAEPDDQLRFVTFAGDSVIIQRSNRNLEILRWSPSTGLTDTTSFNLNLTNLLFSSQPDSVMFNFANFLRVNVETTSRVEQHARFRGDDNRTVRARAQKEIFLRHRAALNQ